MGEKDYLEPIYPNTVVTLNGEPIIVYGMLPEAYECTQLRTILKSIRYSKNKRLTNYINKPEVTHTFDVTFGFSPPNRVFGTSVGANHFNGQHSSWYKALIDLGHMMCWDYYAEIDETRFFKQKSMDVAEPSIRR